VTACARTDATQVHTYLAAYDEAHLSSGAVLLARGDTVVFTEGFGYADVNARVANTAGTRFRIGSITKSMTWAAVHRLVERGMLDLDRSAAELVGSATLPSTVTVRHLLRHEGGVADWGTFPDVSQFTTRQSSLEELTEWVASQPLIFAPGTDRQYSNSGYIVLARIIETVSGRPYGTVLSEEFFQPLGMHATRHDVDAAAGDVAQGYVQGHEPTPVVEGPADHPSILVGSGSVVSTVNDLFVWSRSAAARQFPWDRRQRHGREVAFLGGFVPGYGAWVEHYEREDLTVVVLTNLNNGAIQTIVSDLGAMLLGESYEPPPRYQDRPIGSRGREAFVGSWSCGAGVEFTIQPAGQRLEILWRHRGPVQPLWAQADTVLFYPQDWATITVRGAGEPPGLRYGVPAATPPTCTARPPAAP
jgi:CubicO group peptidase (beta-lactamase class C family)